MPGTPTDLPIGETEGQLVAALTRGSRVVLEAPTGSGKSTQIPQILFDHGLAGNGRIVVLQPRRLAARMLARWVAKQRGTRLGGEIGYQVRFDDKTGNDTRICYETDGILLRRLSSEPELRGIDVIVFDEFHERHVYGDVLLAVAQRLQQTARPDLKVIVMSATLEASALEAYLSPCDVIRSEGRTFPVEVEYLRQAGRSKRAEPWDVAADAFDQCADNAGDGDILVFMPGAYEIRRTIEALGRCRKARDYRILPLYGELSADEQDAAVGFCERRKIVVATNVAETSITIDGVTAVMDSGLARKARFDPNRGINTLLIEKISQASADQRTGRAGRTRNGYCLRLWTERDHAARQSHDPPELQRIDLSPILLALKTKGIGDFDRLNWLDPAPELEITRARGLLTDLGAFEADGRSITRIGRRMRAFPLHPRQGRMLLEANARGCVPAVALVTALCQEKSILLRRQNRDVLERRERVLGEEEESDLLLMLRAWRYARDRGFATDACAELGIHARTARTVGAALKQVLGIADRMGLDTTRDGLSSESIRKCVLAGHSDMVARRVSAGSNRYHFVHARRGTVDADSVVRGHELVVPAEVNEIGKSRGEVDVRVSQVTAIEQEWLAELFPGDLRTERAVEYDRTSKRVVQIERRLFRDLVIEEKRGGAPPEEKAAAVLANLVRDGTLVLKKWDHRIEQWICRLNILAEACPELGLPAMTDEGRQALLEQLCLGAMGYKDIKEREVWPTVRAWLSRAQQDMIDKLAPERLRLSNGREPKVIYAPDTPPHIAMRVQELYDVTTPLTIAMGNVRVQVHVQGPNHRLVQITDDLASFWANTYPQVKKDLQGRYPKHEWR